MFSPYKSLSVIIVLLILLAVGLSNSALADERQKEDQAKAEAYFQQAREALNRNKFEDAAERFARAFELSQSDRSAGDALYWEAFARYRMSRTQELKRAIELLHQQKEQYADAATAAEGEALAARVYAELAERGEADAAREITQRASEEEIRQETRIAALQALMQMNSEKAMPLLKKIVLDDSPQNRDLRRNAIFIMCQQGGDQAEDVLIDLLQKERDPEFLSEIVMCLSMSGSQRALDALMEVFRQTKDPQVAEAALMSISQHGGSDVFDFLASIARDKDRHRDTRAQAIMALSMTGQEDRVADIFIDILRSDPDREILEVTLMGLSNLDSAKAKGALMELVNRKDADEKLKTVALHFAAMSGEVDLNMLRKLYKGAETRDMKQQICHLLTMMDDHDQALDLLIEIARSETDPEIRRDAVFWIGQFDNERAAEYLLDVINEK